MSKNKHTGNLMKKNLFKLLSVILLMFTVITLSAASGDNTTPQKKLFDDNAKKVVYFVPQFSDFKEISEQDRFFLKKVLKRAKKDNVKAVIFELDTPGGRIDIAMKYISILEKAGVPVIAYLNPQGISAGAIIALAAERIAISPNGMIGDAMPIQIGPGGIKPITDTPPEQQTAPAKKPLNEQKDKTDSADKDKKTPAKKTPGEKLEKDKKPASKEKKEPSESKSLKEILKKLEELKKKQRTTPSTSKRDKDLANQKFLTVFFKSLQILAEKNNRPVRVIRAMADPYQKLTMKDDGYEHSKISPLTLSAKEAKKLNVVDYICDDKEDLLEQLGLGDCELKIIKKTPTEQLMGFLAHPAITAILLILGLLGIYVEIRTPGFGVLGILGVTALTMFFLGHVASGASDWGPMVIFFVGIMLIALELFVIPGFGIVGILGILCVMISLFGAFGTENIDTAVNVIGISILSAIAISVLLTIYILPKSTLFKRITLSTSQNSNAGYSAPHQEDESLLGKVGIVYSKLRPSGSVVIEDKRYDATAMGEYIEKGTKVKVISLNGFQLTVEKMPESDYNTIV
jgi:membrane-bound serine protease (ClpP class)